MRGLNGHAYQQVGITYVSKYHGTFFDGKQETGNFQQEKGPTWEKFNMSLFSNMYITMYIIQVYMAQCAMYISYNYTTSFITL